MRNIQSFYQNEKGWSSGPHLFVDEDELFGMCDFRKKGVHAVSFNKNSIGIEVLGDYDRGREDPKGGRGLRCWVNTAAATRVLLDWLGLKANSKTINFHREDPRTSKSCPGTAVEKSWFLGLIPDSESDPVFEPVVYDKPEIGMPWESWHFAGEQWCVPILEFLVAKGTPFDDVVANLKSKSGKLHYGDEYLEGSFYVSKDSDITPNDCSWAPVRELLEISGRNLITLPAVADGTPAASEKGLHFGIVLDSHRFRTSDGEFFLSSSEPAMKKDEYEEAPFSEVRELSGHFVALRGIVDEKVICDCTLVEVAPPIASGIFAKLVHEDYSIRDRVLAIARETRNELSGAAPAVPENEKPLKVSSSTPKPVCVIDIGHSKSRPGACGRLNGRKVCEFSFNSKLAEAIAKKVGNADILITSRPDNENGYSELPGKINALQPTFAISLHANGNGSTATGSEVLHWHSSSEGRRLAGILQDEFLKALKLSDRGLKPCTATERGGTLLQRVLAPIVIGEPFFITNRKDLRKANAKKEALATAYANAIDEYAADLSLPEKSVTSTKSVTSNLKPSQGRLSFKTKNLSKEAFLSGNEKALSQLIEIVNARLLQEYGSGSVPVTREDVWILTYSEAGLRNGKVDPDHRHSEGERGLLPLPSNIEDWNGSKAPNPDRIMPIGRNLEHFYLYLGQLKNKPVTTVQGRTLYRDLFRVAGIAGDPVVQAKVLAGVVHGYFYSGTYRNGRVPYEDLIRGFEQGLPVADIMSNTGYKHAGSSVLTGRDRNIKKALSLL